MLSLPDGWDYTENGLVLLSKDGRDCVRKTLKELEMFGYLVRYQTRDKGAFSSSVYDVYEKPLTESPILEKPITEKPILENHTQINTNQLNKEELNNNKSNKEKKHKYGEFKNVLLTDAEVEKLKAKLPDWEKWIETLSQGIELKGYKYKSHYLAILKWAGNSNAPTSSRTYTEFWE